ncbi:hypothetical protein CONLIGDRAFT_629201 [Coniochaeta ligniaria NRRL 30616]|uniref:Uncharacterized protein n=1 Tax=Coniochaeta ligniaria NRRL 30616 TaxID=1408157 RepID=A0A1J7IVK4_9PEZI|nr:hypothetical protein CONLIGDRAFT_629201 [Coniochaeta ligniaria NRRL 30616]
MTEMRVNIVLYTLSATVIPSMIPLCHLFGCVVVPVEHVRPPERAGGFLRHKLSMPRKSCTDPETPSRDKRKQKQGEVLEGSN